MAVELSSLMSDPPRRSERKGAASGRSSNTSHLRKRDDRAIGGGAVKLGELQISLLVRRKRKRTPSE
jgi:hypothetical protein